MREDVERGALPGEQRARRPREGGHLRRDRVTPFALGPEPLELSGAGLAKDLRRDVEPVDDPALLLDDAAGRDGALRNHRVRGDVAGPQVLGERPSDEIAERGIHGR